MKVPEKIARIALALCLTMQLVPQAAYAEILEGAVLEDQPAVEQVMTLSDEGGETNVEPEAEPTPEPVAVLAAAPASEDDEPMPIDDPPAGDVQGVSVTSFKMKWVPNSSTNATVSDDGTTLTLKPSTNSAAGTCAMAQYEITLSGRQDDLLAPGSVVVRVPAHVFKDRDGNIIKTPVSKKVSDTSVTEPSGPMAPGTGDENAFNWTYDEATDEIVYTNFREMTVHEGFTVRVQYQISSVQVESGATVDARDSSYSVSTPGGENAITGTTPGLKVKVETDVNIDRAQKESGDKYESWQPAWGAAPADAADYYYVTWKLGAHVPSGVTQPFSLSFDESKETNPDNTAGNDDIVAWTTGAANSTWVQEYDGKTGAEGMKADKVLVTSTTEGGSDGGYAPRYYYRTIVTRYPKSTTANGATPKVKNSVTAVVEGVDGAKAQKVTFAYYTYSHVGFVYGGNRWATRKNAWYDTTDAKNRECKGGLSTLRAGKDYKGGSWSIYAMNQMAQTGADGTILPDDQQPDYGTVLRDGLLFIDGERLQPGDYEYTGFYVRQFDEYMAVNDPNKGLTYTLTQDTDGFEDNGGYADNYHPVTVYTRNSFDGEWTEYGVLTKTGPTSYDFNGTPYSGIFTVIPLPAGACDVKFVHMGNQNKVELRFGLADTLHPTEHVMGLIGEDTTQFDLYNIHDAWITDADGNKVSGGNVPTMDSTTGIKDAVVASDAAEYADGTSYHDYSYHVYKSFTGTSRFSKSMRLIKEDTANRVENIQVDLYYEDYCYIYGTGLKLNEAIDLGVVKEQRECKFYDLLPAGCTVDLKSIKVAPYGSGFGGTFTNCDGVKTPCNDFDYTVEMVDNWRGSGQTMMIITVKAPDGVRNFWNSASYVETGFQCRFTMIDTFENIATNGGNLKNSAAVASQDGPLSNGRADDGGTLSNKDLFKGLNDAGGDLDGEKNVMYATASTTVTPTVGSEFKFKKYVKSAEDATYGTSTKVDPTGSYSYQLLVKNDSNNKQSGIILYDILENAYDEANGSENPYWKGELTGVDYSQATRLGADVVVYYSTRTDWNGLGDRADLTNTDVWTTTAPADLSTVTAVAFDCSAASAKADAAHTDGHGGFVLPAEENLACFLYMKAPANYQDLMDDPETTEDETHKAYNTAFATTTRYNADDPADPDGGSTSTTESNRTEVEEEGPGTELDKTSDPASGTADAPTKVAPGDTLTYNLAVRNTNIAEAISDVTVVDPIPAGLMVDIADIRYYSNNHTAATKPCDGTGLVKVEKNGQTLTFTIDKVAARETIHLVIPTTVGDSANAGMTYDNQAKVTKYNGHEWEITSDETHHESDPVVTSIDAKKNWGDNDDEHDTRQDHVTVQLQADGVDVGEAVVLNDANSWKTTFANLKVFRADGLTKIKYTIRELETFPLYDTTYSTETDADGKTTLVVTNSLREITSENARFSVTKTREGSTTFVPGVTFKAYTDAACTNEVASATTDDSGVATFEFIEKGHDADADAAGRAAVPLEFHGADGKPLSTMTLYVKEVSAPHGYTVNDAAQAVTLTRPAQPTINIDHGNNVVEHDYDWAATVATGSALTLTDAAANAFTMANAYVPTAVRLTLPIEKTITDKTGRPSGEKTFSFNLEAEGTAPMPAAGGEAVTVTGEGTASFGAITFTAPGEYEYTVLETNGGEPGYTYAPEYEVTVEVVDQGGYLKIAKLYYDGVAQTVSADGGTAPELAFVNTYEAAKTHVELGVTKAIEGTPRTEGLEKDFTFHLSAVGDAPMPGTTTGATAVVTDEGSSTFDRITYTKPGTYTYKLVEGTDVITPDGGDPDIDLASVDAAGHPGYTYDTKVVYVQVVVTDHGGSLVVDSTEYGTMADGVFVADADQAAAKTFTNTYAPTAAEVTIPVTKTITGDDRPSEKDFQFTLANADGEVETITITGEGTASFDTLSFDAPGTYAYTVTEVDGGETGYAYDDATHDVVVTVTDADDGTLVAAWTIDGEAAPATGVSFENAYAPVAATGTIPVTKQVEGDDRAFEKDFEFTLSDASGVIDTVTITDEGEAEFGELTFEHAGTYEYTVAETEGDEPGYTYDATTFTATATVTDVDGELQVEWAFASVDGEDVDAPAFVNAYAPAAAEAVLSVTKAITGDARPGEKDFQFTLANDEGKIETVTVTGEGTADFAPLTFEHAGRYDFTVTEVDGGEKGYTYDTKAHKATAVVTDVDGALAVSWEFDGEPADRGELTITNTFTAEKTTVTTTTKTTVTTTRVANTGDATVAGAGLAVLAILGLGALLASRRLARR